MASKNIKGITIEIGGNTTKLQDALKGVDKQVYSLNSDLKSLNQALKLDPKNTELLAQKQDVLKKNIQATTERLNTLKEAQKQMGNYNSLTEEQKANYRALSVEIAKSENALKSMNTEMKKTNGVDFSKVQAGLKKVGNVALDVSKKMLKVSAAIGGALTAVVTAGVKSYADLEQNLGGVETLFKDSADKVIKNAKNAYKTAGVSANEYMQGVTSFSASLLQSVGNDTSKAADIADMAFRDMSDNANKFGTDMASIQHAYQGFAKQNYTMLDNLKLGYGGTKTEMERLLSDAEKLTGKKYDIKNLSDVYNAIHAIQNKLGVTGTTAEEAEKTISGSVNSMKAAFDNFLNGSGGIDEVVDSLDHVIINIASAFTKLAPSIIKGIGDLLMSFIPYIEDLSYESALLDAISNLIDNIYKSITENTQSLKAIITNLVDSIVSFVTNNLPKIIELGIQLIVTLAEGIAESIPTMIPAIVQCILQIVDVFLNNIDKIIEVAVQIIMAIIQGITEALPILIKKLPEIIMKIVQVLIENLPLIVDAAIQIIFALIQGLIEAIPELVKAIPKITIAIIRGIIQALPKFIEGGGKIIASIITGISNSLGKLANKAKEIKDTIINKIKNLPKEMANWGKDMILGLANGIKNAVSNVTNAVKGVANKIKNFLHFSRPDEGPLREYEKWMPDFIGGLAEGINKSSYMVKNAANRLAENMSNIMSVDNIVSDVNSAMRGLNAGIENSVNPIINPTANTNPLIIQIENFNNNSESDIQSLAQKLEFYRKNTALARGGK